MIAIISVLLGCCLGVYVAKKRGGSLADMVQYGLVFAIAFGLVTLFVAIFLGRLL